MWRVRPLEMWFFWTFIIAPPSGRLGSYSYRCTTSSQSAKCQVWWFQGHFLKYFRKIIHRKSRVSAPTGLELQIYKAAATEISMAPSIFCFKSRLETHLFSLAFPWLLWGLCLFIFFMVLFISLSFKLVILFCLLFLIMPLFNNASF